MGAEVWLERWLRPNCWMALSADQGSSSVMWKRRRWLAALRVGRPAGGWWTVSESQAHVQGEAAVRACRACTESSPRAPSPAVGLQADARAGGVGDDRLQGWWWGERVDGRLMGLERKRRPRLRLQRLSSSNVATSHKRTHHELLSVHEVRLLSHVDHGLRRLALAPFLRGWTGPHERDLPARPQSPRPSSLRRTYFYFYFDLPARRHPRHRPLDPQ
jgi:hypothetical protein